MTGECSDGKKRWSIKAGEPSVPYLTELTCVSPAKTARRSDLNSGVSFDMTVQSESARFPEFTYNLTLDGKPQALEIDPDSNSANSETLNISIFMTPKLGSDNGYELCVESIDLFGEIKSGLYEITVSGPSQNGTLSAAARLTVLSDSGSSGGGSGGGSSGGGSGGGFPGQPDVPAVPSDPELPPASQLFTDIPAGSWYESSVSFTAHRGLFTGIGNNRFNPSGKTSRAMVMTVLAKMAGQNVSGYDEAVTWAVSTGVSDGTNRHKEVTREQLAAMLYRYAGSPQREDTVKLESFTDRKQISPWAEKAMEWAVFTGILQGQSSHRLNPRATATRAEMAAIIERFVKLGEQ